jgi:ribosomal protein S3
MKKILLNIKKILKFFFNFIFQDHKDENDNLTKYVIKWYCEEHEFNYRNFYIHEIKTITKKDIIYITIKSSFPGIIIGKGGRTINDIKEKLHRYLKKTIAVNIIEFDPLK